MMTVKEASRLTGISIRTLQYYDKLGLLPAMRTESGYRLYDDAALERLQQILLFRELEFPLRDIRTILDNPNFDRRKALRQQIELLTLKKQHLEDLIRLARTLQVAGGHTMQFKEFDTSRIDEYTRRAKESWGDTPAYREFEQNAAERTVQESSDINNQLMALTAGFGTLQNLPIDNPAVQAQAAKLQASSPSTTTPAQRRFSPSSAKCTALAESSPPTSTPQAAPALRSLPQRRLRRIARNKA